MKDLAPQITRQRLLVEGYYAIEVDRAAVDHLLARGRGEGREPGV